MWLAKARASACARAWPLAALISAASPAGAQTIADYSRSQRALREATMAQNAARAAAVASTATSAPSAAAPSALTPMSAAVPRVPARPLEPNLRVSGVFASERRTLAEIAVDGMVWLLEAGQAVPGTRWRVGSIAADRVVIDRPASRDAAGPIASASRTFMLAAAR
jgi:type IV pilus biogenesis protein PilP